MKNMISYYYGLNIECIKHCNEKYYITADNENYILKKIADNITYLDVSIIEQLARYKYFFKIKKNINNDYITMIDRQKYVLLKQEKYKNYRICLNDVKTDYYLYEGCHNRNNTNWITLWEAKIDAYEKNFNLKKEQYYDLIAVFNYYIGIGENAILYLKKVLSENKNEHLKLVASHKRLGLETTLYDYYDPTNIIIDYRSRDIAEYIKSKILENKYDAEEFEKYITNVQLSKIEIGILFSRIIFPTFFFDYMEKDNNINKMQFIEYINRYEKGIYSISQIFNKHYNLEEIEWISKNKTKY